MITGEYDRSAETNCSQPREMGFDPSFQVGIMADSHGDADAICSALELFQDRKCRRIYHLGDICDSLRPETADACIRPLQSANVIAVRGNNDHSLLTNQKGRSDAVISDGSRDFIERLPLKASFCDANLVHSLPFTEKLGLSSMIGSLGSSDAERYFRLSDRPILFRAHSHSPGLMWNQNGQFVSRPLTPPDTVELGSCRPCIITCGALTDGFCLTWTPALGVVTCLQLPPHISRAGGSHMLRY